jgi:hypothetical protein
MINISLHTVGLQQPRAVASHATIGTTRRAAQPVVEDTMRVAQREEACAHLTVKHEDRTGVRQWRLWPPAFVILAVE